MNTKINTADIDEPRRITIARDISQLTYHENLKRYNVPSEEELAKLPPGRAALRAFAITYVAQKRHIVK